MSWSTLATVFNVLNGGWTFFKNLLSAIFGKKEASTSDASAAGEKAATQAVQITNDTSRQSAETARQTAEKLNKELSDEHAQEAADIAALRTPGSVRHDVIANAIARHNRRHASADPDSDDQANGAVRRGSDV